MSRANVAPIEVEDEEEEEEEAEADVGVEENSQEDAEMDFDLPVEHFGSRRSKRLSSITEAPELEEEEAKPEPMDLEPDARLDEPPEDEPDEPPRGPWSRRPSVRGRREAARRYLSMRIPRIRSVPQEASVEAYSRR